MSKVARSGVSGLALITIALTMACGGGNNGTSPTSPSSPTPTPPSGGGGGGILTFKVDGVSESASSVTANFANGSLSIGGNDASHTTTIGFAVSPTGAGPGTYTLGPLSSANAQIMIGNPAVGWHAAVGIGSGTITISVLTSTNASGTFSFMLAPDAGATGTKAITEGVFNVPLTAAPTPPPTPTGGSAVSALIDGVAWTSSLSSRATLTSNILAITGQDANSRVITLAIPISAGLLVPPSSPPTISLDFTSGVHGTVMMVLGAQNWDNGHAGASGSATVTAISSTHVTGTFTVTLVGTGSTAHLTNGQFDLALQRF